MLCVCCWNKCIDVDRRLSKGNIFAFGVFIVIITTLLSMVLPKSTRIFVIFIFLIIACKRAMHINYSTSIVLVIISQGITWIGEFSFAIFISLFYHGDIQELVRQPWIYLLLNFYVTFILFVSLKLKIPQYLFEKIKSYKSKTSVIYSIIVIFLIILSTIESYMKLTITTMLIINVSMAIVLIFIIFMAGKTKANYDKISKKYQTSVSSLKEFEIVIDKFGMITHENKNEFQTIRNMLKAGEDVSYVVPYIDKLIDNNIKDNVKIMKQTSKIPNGGLRTIIYSKLCRMDSLKIKYKLRISKDVHTTDLINIDEELTLKICKILGVFLDNAIDAVENLNNKQIIIEIYIMDEFLCIDITNNFEGDLDLNKICVLKYTTKGEGHGYGLPLVNQILNGESDNLLNEKSINGDTFTQTLKIKM